MEGCSQTTTEVIGMDAHSRKLAVLCWHILMDHPTPSREREAATRSKLTRQAWLAGKECVKSSGYSSGKEFVDSVCSELYGHLPEKQTEEVAVLDNA